MDPQLKRLPFHPKVCLCFGGGCGTYVLCEEEIQYWDSGLFMSSGTTVKSRGSHIEFSLENKKVRNYEEENMF